MGDGTGIEAESKQKFSLQPKYPALHQSHCRRRCGLSIDINGARDNSTSPFLPIRRPLMNQRALCGFSALSGVLAVCSAWPVAADQPPTLAPSRLLTLLPPISSKTLTVTAERLSLIGTASTASEGVVVNDELTLQRPTVPAKS
jgi:hypothetical protein